MIYVHVIGRIGKDAEVKNGKNGDFMSMDIAVDNFVKGEQTTTWIRVRSNRSNHINLAQYLKKGKLLLVEGVLGEPEIWTDKQSVQHVQLSIIADSITFVSTGKKKEDVNSEDTSTPPADAPSSTGEDLPF